MNVDNSIIGIHSVFLQMLIVARVCAYVCDVCSSFQPSASLPTRVHLCSGPGLCPQPAVQSGVMWG